MTDFIVEILTEELPPKSLTTLNKSFADGISAHLEKHQLHFDAIDYYASPRRLTVIVKNLDAMTQSESIMRQGPSVQHAFDADGNPTKAASGFAKGLGVEVSDLARHKTDKGEWLCYEVKKDGQPVTALLESIVSDSLDKLPIPKPMRWGDSRIAFVRPVHGILMLYGQEVVPATVLGRGASNQTVGHRFHQPQAITINDAESYLNTLEKAQVIACHKTRREVVVKQITAAAEALGGNILSDEALIDEVTALVEWPKAISVPFEQAFLAIPKEVLMTSMASHQKCFAVADNNGELMPYFITVSNIEPNDISSITKGNEKVMRARLSDAQFFYQKDKETRLEEKAQKLNQVLFHPKLGSVFDKSERVKQLALMVSHQLEANHDWVRAASDLAKADLVSLMVGEFPSLQGVMGQYYAEFDGEEKEVSQALFEQYLPRFSGDRLPQTKTGYMLSLADRLDTLVAIFAIGEKPSGVKDPFKCRRHALAIVRLLLKEKTPLRLQALLDESAKHFDKSIEAHKVVLEVKQFIIERFRAYMLSQDVRHDVIDSVLAVSDDDLYDAHCRMQALSEFAKEPAASDLSQAFKRVRKLLAKAELKQDDIRVDSALLQEAVEQALHQRLTSLSDKTEPLLAGFAYHEALLTMAEIKPEVDAFFDQVMVMVDDAALKHNRLSLLHALQQQFLQVADISHLE